MSFKYLLSLTLLVASVGFADPRPPFPGGPNPGGPNHGPNFGHGLPSQVSYALDAIENGLRDIEYGTNSIHFSARREVAERLESDAQRLQNLIYTLRKPVFPPAPVAGWVATNGQSCLSVCQNVGLRLGVSPEGAQCASGENRPASAIASGQVSFVNGCFPRNCPADVKSFGVSQGAFCYAPGQKQDNDGTDVTVGCYCTR